jgi:hypothetical protein
MSLKTPHRNLLFFTCNFFLCSIFAQETTWQWSKHVGNANQWVMGRTITTDPSGNIYMAGEFQGTIDFDAGPGVFNLTSAGSNDVFISKTDASGNFFWAKAISGISTESVDAIKLDDAGNIFISGGFFGTVDFDPGPGTYPMTSPGGKDMFVVKLNNSGNLIWAKSMGGGTSSNGIYVKGIDFDAFGNIYTAGTFSGTQDFDPGAGVFNLGPSGPHLNTFILKLDSAANFIWAKEMYGSSIDGVRATGMDADSAGNVFIAGYFQGPVYAGTLSFNSIGTVDIFVCRLSAAGNFIWAKTMGGTAYEEAWSIAIDNSDNIYVQGDFEGTVDFDPGAGVYNLTTGTSYNLFITKLNSAGNFIWAKQIDGAHSYMGVSMLVDDPGYVYASGCFSGTADFDPNGGVYNLTSAGGDDLFVLKMDTSGNFLWAKSTGGPGLEVGFDLTLDANKKIDLIGNFQSSSVIFDPDTVFNSDTVGTDMFYAQLCEIARPAISSGGPASFCSGDSVTLTSDSAAFYLWSNGAISQSIIVSDANNYSLSVSNLIGCSAGSSVITTSVNPLPIVELDLTNFGSICSDAAPVMLSQGNPSGGVYSNPYMSGAYFDPVPAGYGVQSIIYTYTDSNGCSNSDTANVYIDLCTEIQNREILSGLMIAPNPFNTETRIVFAQEQKQAVVRITDLMGKEIKRFLFSGSQLDIERGEMVNGVYFIEIVRENSTVFNRKLVLQ